MMKIVLVLLLVSCLSAKKRDYISDAPEVQHVFTVPSLNIDNPRVIGHAQRILPPSARYTETDYEAALAQRQLNVDHHNMHNSAYNQ